jgi:hypothetical protein
MSKYNALWKFVKKDGRQSFKLSFDEIRKITGLPIDHSFLNYKKELLEYGYEVRKISLKDKTVLFEKTRIDRQLNWFELKKAFPPHQSISTRDDCFANRWIPEMKRIEFFSPADGDIIIDPGIDMLRILFLYVGEEFWNSGSGDSYIDFRDGDIENRLEILFSDPHGFYLRYQSKGQDFHSLSKLQNSETTIIYVGGNPLTFPVKLFLPREKAFEVITYFCETGKRLDNVAWIEYDNLEEDWASNSSKWNVLQINMMRIDPIIAVNDVEASSKWYQSVFGCKSMHGGENFDILVSEDNEILLCLHKWGEHGHPTMMNPGMAPANGLILYFRAQDLKAIRGNVERMGRAVEEEVHVNPNSTKMEFSVRDPDGYYLTITEFHRYEG